MKALSLISGGLDSLIATRLILDQGVEVQGIHCQHGFTGDHDFFYKKERNGEHSARKSAEQLGIPLKIVDLTIPMNNTLLSPKYGFGKNLNPCLDCKLLMFKAAFALLKKYQAAFLISGEVVGQRKMSQRFDTMPMGSKITQDLILRPLSAKLLPPSRPEREGWIDREKLLAWHGRDRNPQFAMVKSWNMVYSTPGGGCLLTDKGFCRRLKDLLRFQPNYTREDLWLLRVGRHYRVPQGKLIVGRDQVENNFLKQYSGKQMAQTLEFPGALVLADLTVPKEIVLNTAVYFSKAPKQEALVNLKIGGVTTTLPSKGLDQISALII